MRTGRKLLVELNRETSRWSEYNNLFVRKKPEIQNPSMDFIFLTSIKIRSYFKCHWPET